jgi:hypothetical protein
VPEKRQPKTVNKKPAPLQTNRVLVKLRPSKALLAAESKVNLRPLYDKPTAAVADSFGIDSTPQWFLAELPDAPENPWDLAHTRVSEQLGVDESDVVFAEPVSYITFFRTQTSRTLASLLPLIQYARQFLKIRRTAKLPVRTNSPGTSVMTLRNLVEPGTQ